MGLRPSAGQRERERERAREREREREREKERERVRGGGGGVGGQDEGEGGRERWQQQIADTISDRVRLCKTSGFLASRPLHGPTSTAEAL